MTSRRVSIPLALLLVLTCASIAFFVYFGPDFPPNVAMHFGADGRANGYMDRVKFIVLSSFVSFMLPTFIVTVIGVFPRVMPVSAMNIPGKSYWSATADRREELLTLLLWFGLWMGCLIQAFLVAINASLLQANRVEPASLPPWSGWVLSVAFLGGLLAWIGAFLRALKVPRANLP